MFRIILSLLLTMPLFTEFRTPPEQQFDPLPPMVAEGDDRQAWQSKRGAIRAEWEKIIGPMPQAPELQVEVVSREELDDHSRLLLRYRNEADGFNDAYLLIPRGIEGKRPGIVVLHPTSAEHIRGPVGLANRETNHHALHLVRRGYVCIAPRNFLWAVEGRSWQEAADDVLRQGPYTTGMGKMMFDAMRAVDVLADRPEVDASRIGAVGHSLGGKEALYLAALDERIIASISSEGGVGLAMSNWEADWYLGQQIKSPQFTHDNHQIMSLIAPRALLVIGGESADGAQSWPYIEAVLPIWRLYGAEAKLGLLRHEEGHRFPSPGPDRESAYRWLDHWMDND